MSLVFVLVALAFALWRFGTRATFAMVALYGFGLGLHFGLHFVTAILLGGAFLVGLHMLLAWLRTASVRLPWLEFVEMLVVSGIPFWLGFHIGRHWIMASAPMIEAWLGGLVAGAVLAVAAYRDYQRSVAEAGGTELIEPEPEVWQPDWRRH